MNSPSLVSILAVSVMLSACGDNDQASVKYGPEPTLPEQQRGLLPNMTIAEPALWGDQLPTVPQNYRITAIATDLKIPRQTLLLPNGDILVAEGRGGNASKLKPKDVIAGYIKAQGNTSVKGGNRLTLLRDSDNDGTYEEQVVFAEDLNAPYGLALVGNKLYVANQDALVRFDYQEGQTQASGPPVKVTDLPSEINHHWTKPLAASTDGRWMQRLLDWRPWFRVLPSRDVGRPVRRWEDSFVKLAGGDWTVAARDAALWSSLSDGVVNGAWQN